MQRRRSAKDRNLGDNLRPDLRLGCRPRLRYFKATGYADPSLDQWLASTARALVQARPVISTDMIAALPVTKNPILPG
jgi:hypothetical protein